MAEREKKDNPALQQIGKLNLRLNDFIEELNKTLKVLIDDSQAKDAEILKLKGQIVKEANKDVPLPEKTKQ